VLYNDAAKQEVSVTTALMRRQIHCWGWRCCICTAPRSNLRY